MKIKFAIASILLFSLLSLGNTVFASSSSFEVDTSFALRIQSFERNESTSFQNHYSKAYYNSGRPIRAFHINDLEVEENEEKVKKKHIPSYNWERDAAVRNVSLSLSESANIHYSSPQCNSFITRSSLRTHVPLCVFII